MEFLLKPGGTMTGEARVPGDKSMSHRSIMLGALAEGTTRVTGFLEGEDALATLAAFRAMGVAIDRRGEGEVIVWTEVATSRKPSIAPNLWRSSSSAGGALDVVTAP